MPPLLPAFSPNFVMYCLGLASYFDAAPPKDPVGPAPSITAIVPAFNEEGSIAWTLESLLRQERAIEKIVVVDDGSTDGTSEVARGFRGVRLLRNPWRMGKAESVNRALDLVYTELAMIVDADTVLEESYTEKAVKAFTEEDVAAAGGFVLPSPRSTNTAIRRARVVENIYSQTTLRRGRDMINGTFVVPGCCAVFRTSILKRLRIPTGTVTEDLDLTWLIELGGYRTALVGAYAKTLEPSSLKAYVAQIRRWYTGFFQCLEKHGSKLFASKPLTFTVASILTECLVFTLFWAAALGLAISFPWLSGRLTYLRGFVLTLLAVDIITVSFPALFKAHSEGLLKEFIYGLPVYYSLRIVNTLVWWTTFVEWLFGLKTAWGKTH